MKESYDKTPPTSDLHGEILTLKQLAEYLKCHTVSRLVRHGGVPHFRLGSDFRFLKSTIDSWIRNQASAKVLRHVV